MCENQGIALDFTVNQDPKGGEESDLLNSKE